MKRPAVTVSYRVGMLVAWLSVFSDACHRLQATAPGSGSAGSAPTPAVDASAQQSPVADPAAFTLPNRAGAFAAGPLERQGGALRRTYSKGQRRIPVTLVHFPMTPPQYEEWVRTSIEGFPQATLDVPPGTGNGFYQCTPGTPQNCNLLIQLSSGVHLEIRGDGSTSRADVDALARGLPLAALGTHAVSSSPSPR